MFVMLLLKMILNHHIDAILQTTLIWVQNYHEWPKIVVKTGLDFDSFFFFEFYYFNILILVDLFEN